MGFGTISQFHLTDKLPHELIAHSSGPHDKDITLLQVFIQFSTLNGDTIYQD